jgi:GNAT superfamily N-acetyltransferase
MDEPVLRPARPRDLDDVASFTRETFSWGDYVADALPDWLDDPDGAVTVAERDGRVIGIGRTVLMSDREAWLHAVRIHPDHRREGIGTMLNEAGCRWARERGALVARLMVEDWNEPAREQVAKLGYRVVSHWDWATRPVGSGKVDPRTNGGKRVPGEERLTRAPTAEAGPAWIAWSTGELAAAARQLFPIGWHFRTMTAEDVAVAAREKTLFQSPSGWAIAAPDGEELAIPWLATSDLDVDRFVRAVVDHATRGSFPTVRVMAPRVPWLLEQLVSNGFDIHPAGVYARPL